jgi:hypothetical protein
MGNEVKGAWIPEDLPTSHGYTFKVRGPFEKVNKVWG